MLPDLLGLRLLGGDVAGRVREHLPRVGRARLVDLLGVGALRAGTDPALAAEAAAAAIGHEDARGKSPVAVAARRALLVYLTDLGAPHALGRRAAWRLRRSPPDSRIVRAIALQVGFREDLRAQERAEETLVSIRAT